MECGMWKKEPIASAADETIIKRGFKPQFYDPQASDGPYPQHSGINSLTNTKCKK